MKEESRIAGPVLSKPAYENLRNLIDSSKSKFHVDKDTNQLKMGS